MSRKSHGKNKENALIPASPSLADIPRSYADVLHGIKTHIQHSRLKAVLSANASLIQLYWQIGQIILTRQTNEGWGAKVIDRLSFDLKEAFPDMRGFSPRNLKYMRTFAESYPDLAIVQRVVAQIPWKSNLALLDKIKDIDLRLWYAQKTLENGWSQPVLVFQIESALHQRLGQSNNNFAVSLPPEQSDMAIQIFKDPYIFDFLGTDTPRRELDVEKALTAHVEKFLLELGQGFAFVGRQVLLEVGDSDFRLDLLFYHLKLRCFVVIELKTGKLEPGHISQLGFYIIDMLHRQNKTLEAMAETLFRQWFVVEAREEKPLRDVVDIGIGRTPPRQQHQWFSINPTDIKWISIKDLGNDGIYIFKTSEYLTQAAVEQFNIPVIPENTVVLSFKMTVGRAQLQLRQCCQMKPSHISNSIDTRHLHKNILDYPDASAKHVNRLTEEMWGRL